MAADPETLYRQLGRLIEMMPDLTEAPVSKETHLWLARAYALVKAVNVGVDPEMFPITVGNLGTTQRINAAHQLTAMIYRAFATAEMKAPAGASGAFIPVGDSFDAFSALSKVLQTATKDVLIIDPLYGRNGTHRVW